MSNPQHTTFPGGPQRGGEEGVTTGLVRRSNYPSLNLDPPFQTGKHVVGETSTPTSPIHNSVETLGCPVRVGGKVSARVPDGDLTSSLPPPPSSENPKAPDWPPNESHTQVRHPDTWLGSVQGPGLTGQPEPKGGKGS